MSKISPDILDQNFHLLRTEPEKYLALAEELVRAEPDAPDGYWGRYEALNRLGRFELALVNLNKVLTYDQQWIVYEVRGNVLRALGRYHEALDDYNKAESIDPEDWNGGFGRLYRADCHARLGNEEAALADCAYLRDDHWTPGLVGAPAGNKREVIEEIRRLAAEARQRRHG